VGAGTAVAVGGMGVAIGDMDVAVGDMDVAVGDMDVAVGDMGVAVGGMGVAVGDMDVGVTVGSDKAPPHPVNNKTTSVKLTICCNDFSVIIHLPLFFSSELDCFGLCLCTLLSL
jgi:hypothetical protein